MLVVALLGIPMLLGTLVRRSARFANVERGAANVLLGRHLARAPMASADRGNLWVRLRSMSSERDRWRELGYLMLRFPVGIATFTVAVTALDDTGHRCLRTVLRPVRRRPPVRRLGPELDDGGCRELAMVVVPGAARRGTADRRVPPPERPGGRLRTLDHGLARRRADLPPVNRSG